MVILDLEAFEEVSENFRRISGLLYRVLGGFKRLLEAFLEASGHFRRVSKGLLGVLEGLKCVTWILRGVTGFSVAF